MVSHLRLHDGRHEVDLIVERGDGGVLAIEVKLGGVVETDDVKHLTWLKDRLGDQLVDAIVISTGTHAYRCPGGIAVVPAAPARPLTGRPATSTSVSPVDGGWYVRPGRGMIKTAEGIGPRKWTRQPSGRLVGRVSRAFRAVHSSRCPLKPEPGSSPRAGRARHIVFDPGLDARP